MPWFKVDDSFESHPKVKAIPRARRIKAIGLWTLAGSWAARQLTDGFVPTYMLDELAASKTEANTLIEVGLWSAVDGGYVFKDWHDWQPTKAKVEADREAAKERMRAARERKRGTRSQDVRANGSATPPNGSGEVRSTPRSLTPTRPDPSRPDPKENTPRAPRSATDIPGFDEFWTLYPRKVAKPKALTAFKAAAKKADTAVILAGLRAHLPALEAAEPRYRPHPATWLNQERWADAPPPLPQSNMQAHLALVEQLGQEQPRQIGGSR